MVDVLALASDCRENSVLVVLNELLVAPEWRISGVLVTLHAGLAPELEVGSELIKLGVILAPE